MKSLVCLFLPGYMFSFYLVFSGDHMFILWAGAEVNLVSFLGLLKSGSSGFSPVNAMKYFVAQTLGSMCVLMGWYLLQVHLGGIGASYLTLGIMMKLGVFPFQGWFMSFVKSAGLADLWFISVPQKLIPLWILMVVSCIKWFLWASVFCGSWLSLLGALGSVRLSGIMGYSSLFNTSWLSLLLGDLDIFVLVYTCYGVSLGFVILSLAPGALRLRQEVSSFSWGESVSRVVCLLNLGGVPPFFNLWNKAATLEFLCGLDLLALAFLYVFFSAGFVYVYVNMFFSELSLLSSSRSTWESAPGCVLGALVVGLTGVFYLF